MSDFVTSRLGSVRLLRSRSSTAIRDMTLATGLLAALPIIVAAVHGIVVHWVPYGDDGVIAARSYDVFSSDTPLVGVYSIAPTAGPPLHKPGPLLFWLLAVPAHFLAPVAMTIVIAVVNVAAVIGIIYLVRRRAGRGLMLATGGAVVLMLYSVGGQTLHDIWNPYAGLLPFTLLIFLCWSIACGDYRLLPLTALVASFVIQAHLTFLAPSIGLLAVAAIGLVITRRSRDPAQRGAASSSSASTVRPSLLGAIAVAIVCWSFPFVDEVIHRPGNLTLLARSALHPWPRLGSSSGWHGVVRAVGIPPWWLRGSQGWAQRIHELVTAPNPLQIASCLVVLAGLIATSVLALRRSRRDVAFAGALGLVLCAALFYVVASGPRTGGTVLTNGYISLWGSAAGMWVWLILGWSIVSLTSWPGSRTLERAKAVVPAVAAAAVTFLALEVAVRENSDPNSWVYGPMRASISHVNHELAGHPRRVRVLTCLSGSAAFLDQFGIGGIVYALRRRGAVVETPAREAIQLSQAYAIRPGKTTTEIHIGVWPCPGAASSS